MRNNFSRLKRLRKEIRKSQPEVIISFSDTTNILTIVACRGLKVPIIVTEHTDPMKHNIGFLWNVLRRIVYPKAQALVVLSEGIRQWALKFMPQKAVHVNPNPISLSEPKQDIKSNLLFAQKNLLAMGRLGHEKGFDLLIQAFAKCVKKQPDWSLLILGDGKEIIWSHWLVIWV